ncbi:MAG: Hsp20/alpha crystallin family protein [Verrucomicrobiota bacterium]
MSRKERLERMIGRTGEVAFDLRNLHFSDFQSYDGWRPDINVYRYDNRIEIWVDLAGVQKEQIKVDVLADQVRISGERQPPLPTRDASGQCRQVLTMEIENGRFERVISLPVQISREKARAKHEEGLLWIVLPLAEPDSESSTSEATR